MSLLFLGTRVSSVSVKEDTVRRQRGINHRVQHFPFLTFRQLTAEVRMTLAQGQQKQNFICSFVYTRVQLVIIRLSYSRNYATTANAISK